MNHSKKILGATLVGILAFGISACSGSEGESGELTPMSIGVAGAPPIFLSTVMQVALDQGYFEEEGLDVELRGFPSGADVARAVQSGELDGGMTVTEVAASVRATGGSLVGVVGYPDSSFTLATSNPDITTCEDMVNATFAGDVPGTPLYIAAETMFASCGLSPDDIETVTVSGTVQVEAIINGQADAAVLHPDLIAMAEQTLPITMITTVAEANPEAHYMMTVTSEEQLDDPETRENWVKLLRAHDRAVEFMYDESHAEAVAESASEITTRDVDIALGALPTFLAMDFWSNGYDGLPIDRIEATIERQVSIGNIDADAAPTAEELVDETVYADAVSE